MSSDLKINCPICNQEFPAYDQRGFRNAGFTAHHKRCLERHQQSNKPQQHDQQASRASRFAWAVRRRLLPALPIASTNFISQGQNINSPQPPLSGSSSSSSSSSSPQKQCGIAIPMTPVVPSQVAHPKQHRHPRQRHTWNHWSSRRRSRRSTINVDTTTTTITTTTPTPITTYPSTNAPNMPTLSGPRIVRPYSSLPVIDTANDSSIFPLLTAITTFDSATALIIPQTASPHLSNQTPATSPLMSVSDSPFSFTSMLTTLPVESTTLLPSTTISTCSSSNNSNCNANDRNSIDIGYSHYSQLQQRPSMAPPDWMFGQYHHYHHHHHRPPGVAIDDGSLCHQQSPQSNNSIHHHSDHTSLFSSPTSLPPPNILSRSLRSPENLAVGEDEPIHECAYCQPQNGQHDPSCSLMQFIMMSILGDHDDPSSSSSR